MKSKTHSTLYLVDISSFIFRAFYAIREMTAPDGTPTNAIYGVASMIGRMLDDANPEYVVIVYDSKEPSFRKEMYEDYKANRSEAPDMLVPQFDLIEEMIKLMGLPSFRQSGIEADDLIATLTKKWVAEDDKHRVVIVTGDKDLMALVTSKVQVWDTMKETHYTPHEVTEKFGVTPSQITDYLAMVGDSSDNIPGITGIGPKGAEALLKEFNTLEDVIAAAKAGKVKGKKGEQIVEGEKMAYLSRDLARLKDDVKLNISIESARFTQSASPELLEFFKKYNLKNLFVKYSKIADGLKPDGAKPMSEDEQQELLFEAPAEGVSGPKGSAVKGSVEFITVDKESELKKLIKKVESGKLMAFDTETTSLDPQEAKLVGIAIAVDESAGYYIPVGHQLELGSKFEQLDLDDVLNLMKPALENPNIKKIGQNLKYDIRVMHNQGVEMQGVEGDTMVAAYSLDSSGRHNLDFLCKKYLQYDVLNYEDVVGKGAARVTFDQVPIDRATRYSAEDAWCALRLWSVLEPQLKKQGVEKLYEDVDLPIVQAVAHMEEAGIKVDTAFLKKLEKQFEKELAEIEKKIQSFTSNKGINLNSPKQLGTLLFDELKLPTQGKTKTGYSTDASVLAALAPLHEVPRLILDYREISKLKGTYVLPLQELRSKRDERVRTSFHLTGTSTGRLSSSDPNIQNIPTRTKRGQLIRQAFIAEEGKVLMSADYSQIELRILAHLSQDPALMGSFQKGEDVHRRTASEIFHVKADAVTDEQRGYAKAINFGLMYGKSAFGLAEELGISRTEAKKMIDAYFTRYAKVKELLDGQVLSARELGYTTTLLGRKRALPEIKSTNPAVRGNAERMAMNSPIQGTAADLIKMAMVKLDAELGNGKWKSRMLLQVHDELLFEAPKSEVEKLKKIVTETMEHALKLDVPLQVNVGTGQNWAEI
ncbi:MAG: DNA polymerase I [Bdellovibrionales bacterium]|nr:DNA polymerase I [Bdellovibrionales bacterium]